MVRYCPSLAVAHSKTEVKNDKLKRTNANSIYNTKPNILCVGNKNNQLNITTFHNIELMMHAEVSSRSQQILFGNWLSAKCKTLFQNKHYPLP